MQESLSHYLFVGTITKLYKVSIVCSLEFVNTIVLFMIKRIVLIIHIVKVSRTEILSLQAVNCVSSICQKLFVMESIYMKSYETKLMIFCRIAVL